MKQSEGYVPQDVMTDEQRTQWAKETGRKVFHMPSNMKEALRFPGCWLTYIGCFFYASVLLSGLSFVLPLYFPAMGYDTQASTATPFYDVSGPYYFKPYIRDYF